MNTRILPICHRCLGPIENDPLLDNASVDLCPKCFEFRAEELGTKDDAAETRHLLFEPPPECYCHQVANPDECRDAGHCIMQHRR